MRATTSIEDLILFQLINSGLLAIVPNYFYKGHECDLFAVTKNGRTTEYEVKCSVSDFRRDFRKQIRYFARSNQDNMKHSTIMRGERVNRFVFIIKASIYEKIAEEIPDYAGVITYEEYETMVTLKKIKTPKTLHKEELSIKELRHLVTNLTWRNYRQLHERWRNYKPEIKKEIEHGKM